MPNANDEKAVLYQNFIDAGFNEFDAHCLMDTAQRECWSELIGKLKTQRSKLLSAIHSQQEKIDCLDFLLHKLNKEKLK